MRLMKITALSALLGATALGAAHAADDVTEPGITTDEDTGRVEIGFMKCELTGDTGNIIVSEQFFDCVFDPSRSEAVDQYYKAKFDKIGLDLSTSDTETIRWAVLAPAEKYETGVLEGEYGGIAADAALGLGAGARLMVGGFEDSITLQPLSVTTTEGIGVSLGAENMTLVHTGSDN